MSQSLKPSLEFVIDKRIFPAVGVVAGLVVVAIILNQKGWLPKIGGPVQEQPGETIDLSNASKVEAIKIGQMDTGETILTNLEGKTLYVNITEDQFKSTCYEECASKWPPLIIASGDQIAGPQLSVITRDDGSLQATINGHPLYTYYKDEKPGDYLGDQVEGIWSAAKMQVTPKNEDPTK